MYPHWQSIVRPLLIARDSRSLVEIGAEEGKNTRNLLDYCRERGATLRAIEPAPKFDVEAWTREHAGRFEVHRGPSLDVLPTLEPFDTILIDGDHNWFTVFHELKLIERRSAELPQPFPLVVLHDIGWPYARRDLYYAPDRIPEAYRHSYARKGMRPGSAALLERGGLNAQLCNALQENTPRNGVLTAVEDFLRESDQAFRFLKLPGYAGLGILCPAQLEEQSVDLAEFLKTWDLPPAVQQFYEQLDQNRSQLRINLMERRPSEEPAMSQSGRGEQGAAERRPALALVGAEATKVGAPKGRQRPSANGPDRLERRRPASGGGGEGGPEEPLGSSPPAADPMAFPGPNVALLYDNDGFVVTAKNLMGRRVAGREFLDAYFRHGRWGELMALVANQPSAKSIQEAFDANPAGRARGRRLRVVAQQEFHRAFFPDPPAPLLHLPGPLDARYAWARWHGRPGSFAISGVTYTISSQAIAQAMCEMVTAPYESYDALICASRVAVDVVRTVADTYAEYLRDRQGGTPGLRPRLVHIPLGVDPEKFRTPTPAERAAGRRALGIADDEVMILFVGRLTFHAKAHPFPMYAGAAQAARSAGRKVHLVLFGTAPNVAILGAFEGGARVFAPGVRVTILDGTKADLSPAIWHAADLFTSLSDSIQETFGLVIVEAMASGLPVVASDWDGYRDMVVDGETGFLVPTYMVRDATSDATSRLIVGEINYDHFLSECNQAVAVDVGSAAEAFRRLIMDDECRRRLGAAGRQRALERFTWSSVVGAHERLWQDQEAERLAALAAQEVRRRTYTGPACYPSPEHSFASYPTALVGEGDRLIADENARERLHWLLNIALTNYEADRRAHEPEVLRAVLAAAEAPCSLGDLDGILSGAGLDHTAGRATVAWMLKYDLLRRIGAEEPSKAGGDPAVESQSAGASTGEAP